MFTLLKSTQDVTGALKATQAITSVPGKTQLVKYTEDRQEDLIFQVFYANENLICIKVLSADVSRRLVNVMELKRAVGVDEHSLVTFDLLDNDIILTNCKHHQLAFETPSNLLHSLAGRSHLIPEPVELESHESDKIKEFFEANQGIIVDPEKTEFVTEIKETDYRPVAIFVS